MPWEAVMIPDSARIREVCCPNVAMYYESEVAYTVCSTLSSLKNGLQEGNYVSVHCCSLHREGCPVEAQRRWIEHGSVGAV